MQKNQFEEPLSDDPQENLRIENDILRIKLHASYGAGMIVETDDELTPEIENEILRNVIAFEEAMEHDTVDTIFNKLGQPGFALEETLTDEEISSELDRAFLLMSDHSIQLDVLGNYEDRVIYKFIVEELFTQEVLSGIAMPGFNYHFIYEEFHPNHTYDIENRVKEFLTDWFEQKFDEYSFELSDPLIVADGRTMKKEELLKKIKMIFDSYPAFDEEKYSIGDIHYQLNEVNEEGMGYAEGNVKYYARLEDGQQVLIGGPFKFYLSHDDNWWQIFYFIFPGFEW